MLNSPEELLEDSDPGPMARDLDLIDLGARRALGFFKGTTGESNHQQGGAQALSSQGDSLAAVFPLSSCFFTLGTSVVSHESPGYL